MQKPMARTLHRVMPHVLRATRRRTVQRAYTTSIQLHLDQDGGEKRCVIRSPWFPTEGGRVLRGHAVTWGSACPDGLERGGTDDVPPLERVRAFGKRRALARKK